MRQHLVLGLYITGLVFWGGCFGRGGSGGLDADSTTPGPTVAQVTSALGLVLDAGGNGLSGVAITAAGKVANSDASGRFSLQIPASGFTVLVFERAGYAPVYRRVEPGGAPSITVSARMTAPTMQTTIDVTNAPATVPVPGGVTVEFPQGSVVTSNGQAPTGPVEVSVTWVRRRA